MIQLTLLAKLKMVFLIPASVMVSRLLVASSSIRSCGCFSSALAIASLCRCSPDRLLPFSSIGVLYPSGRLLINLSLLLTSQARYISSSVALGLPSLRLFLIVSENRKTFWSTYATLPRKDGRMSLRRSAATMAV